MKSSGMVGSTNHYFSFRGASVWLALLLGLSFTALLSFTLSSQRQAASDAQFGLHVKELVAVIEKRLRDHEQILLGAAGLINASSELVNRVQWRTYVESLSLQNKYPGIQGVGFSLVIAPDELVAHIDSVRSEGFPEYQVRPEGERERYTSIIYLEPFSGRNLVAWGYDMYSEPVRRSAMQRAVRTNSTSISNKVKLVQETHGKAQAGFLMYVPVYKPGMPIATEEERWRVLLGFVYSPYRVGDLMQGILGGSELVLDFTLHDGETLEPATLMYDTALTNKGNESAPSHSVTHHIDAYGKRWTLTISSRPAFQQQFESMPDYLIPVLGTGVSISLFALIGSLSGARQRALVLAEDMSARRIAESQQSELILQEQGQYTQAIVDNMIDGIVTIDESGIIQSVNPSAARIFGYSMAMMLGQDVRMLMPQKHRDAFDDYLRTFPHLGDAHHIGQGREVNGLRADGSQFPMELATAMITRRGKRHFVGMVRDISERKRVERMKGEFISTVSHELRTPLTAIYGALGLVLGGALGVLPERIADLLRIAQKNSQRLQMLINDLLDMEKLDAGKMRLELKDNSLQALLTGALRDNQSFADQFGVHLVLQDGDLDVRVRVDAHRFQQVLANLLSNAAKFSPSQGTVTVSVRRLESSVRVSVSDQGKGIPEAFQSTIFQKFAQADSSDAREKGGTGLGLAISRELIERMDGQIGFVSEEGQGTTFWFELPVA